MSQKLLFQFRQSPRGVNSIACLKPDIKISVPILFLAKILVDHPACICCLQIARDNNEHSLFAAELNTIKLSEYSSNRE